MKKASFWKKIEVASVFVAAIGAMVFANLFGRSVVPKVHAATGCTLATVTGTYGFVATGSIAGIGPVAATGLITSDQVGNLKTNLTLNVDGAASTETATGTITVNSDCTFTDSFSDGTTAAGVIVDGGREVDFIETYPGALGFSGVGKRVKGSD